MPPDDDRMDVTSNVSSCQGTTKPWENMYLITACDVKLSKLKNMNRNGLLDKDK